MGKASAKKPKARAREDLGEGPAPGSVPGHNLPAGSDPDEAFLRLNERKRELLDAGTKWSQLTKLTSQEESDNLAGLRKQVSALKRETTEIRDTRRRPHKEAYDAVNKLFNSIIDACDLISRNLEPLQTKWLQAEQARIDAERRAKEAEAEEERKRLEALARRADPHDLASQAAVAEQSAAVEDAEAAAKAAGQERARAGGQFVGVGGVRRSEALVTVYSYAVADAKACAAEWANHPEALALWVKIARAAHTADRDWTHKGITITEGSKAR